MPPHPRYQCLFEPVKNRARDRSKPLLSSAACLLDRPRDAANPRRPPWHSRRGWLGGGVHRLLFDSIPPPTICRTATPGFGDDSDIKNLAVMTEAVHRHGALAACELYYGSTVTPNRMTREMPLSPSGLANPERNRYEALPLADPCHGIRRTSRHWSVGKGMRPGVPRQPASTSCMSIPVWALGPTSFLSPRTNQRSDEYGGSMKNRVRLLREMIDATREAVAGESAVAVRISTDELMGALGLQWHEEACEIFDLVGEGARSLGS